MIDFKGGGMANQFKDLPHLLGTISDIDGKEINRSLLSIRAELDNRKKLFAEADVNSIGQYIRKYRNDNSMVPVPHLVIIVDEFAELKAEQPEFMKELISAARIGRSLGVHLILATQKPAGQVSEQIWSNSRFKLCLKVQSREDSNEMIKSPLAAEIVEPGRAYLQVGNNEIFDLFQSAYSGAPEKTMEDYINSKEFRIFSVSLSGKRRIVHEQKKMRSDKDSKTQLQAVVEYIRDYCAKCGVRIPDEICKPSLESVIEYRAGVRDDAAVSVEIGVFDAPQIQRQDEYRLEISNKNTMIIGSSQQGKTNLLQVIIRGLAENYTPEEVNIYILDFGAMLLRNYEELPHVGGVVCASDEERFKNLFKMLQQEMEVRKEKLMNAKVSSYLAYRQAGYTDLPQIVLMVDNYTGLKESYFGDNDLLLPICREGMALGISVIITNTHTAGFGYRYISVIAEQIALYCNESDEYTTLFGTTRMRPSEIPGRCLVKYDKTVYEAQTYKAFEGEREVDSSRRIQEFVAEQNKRYPNKRAKQIPCVPKVLTMQHAYEMAGSDMAKNAFAIGMDYETIEPVCLNLESQFMLALLGGKKAVQEAFVENLLQDVQMHWMERSVEVHMIDSAAKGFERYAKMPYMKHYTSRPDEVLTLVNQLNEELMKRRTIVDQEGLNALTNLPLELVVVNNRNALESLGTSKNEMKIFEQIMKKYREMKILFVFSDIENTTVGYSSHEMMKKIKEEKKAIIYMPLSEVKVFDISGQTARQHAADLKGNEAFYLSSDGIARIKLVQKGMMVGLNVFGTDTGI